MLRMIAQMLWRRRRNIFRFNDGRSVRAADPIAVAIALHEHKTFLPRHLGEAVDGDAEAQMIVAETACEVFNVLPLAANGKSGLTVSELLELMLAFDAYLWSLKKSTERLLIKRGYTESTSPQSSEPTTNDTSDCGPTATESLSDSPTSLEPESSPLSAT
jgi:hypothetical protein